VRACIFVDGENLRHSIVDLFSPGFSAAEYFPKTAAWQAFFDHLAAKCYGSTRLRTYWYAVEQVEFWPWRLPKKEIETLHKVLNKHEKTKLRIKSAPDGDKAALEIAEELENERRKFEKRFEGWKNVQDGIAAQHDAVEFRRAGTIRYDLFEKDLGTEKAVDVKLGVDLLLLAEIYDLAIIVSGDGDYVPAVRAIKDKGKRVVNVAFETRDGRLLPGGARALSRITDSELLVKFADMKEFMFPSQPLGLRVDDQQGSP